MSVVVTALDGQSSSAGASDRQAVLRKAVHRVGLSSSDNMVSSSTELFSLIGCMAHEPSPVTELNVTTVCVLLNWNT